MLLQKLTLDKIEGAIKNEQSRDTGNIGNTTLNRDKQKSHNTTQKTEKWATQASPENEGEPKGSCWVSSFCFL